MKLFSLLILISFFISCKQSTGEELIKQYILNSTFETKRNIYDIQILYYDSLFSKPSDEPSYREHLKKCEQTLSLIRMEYHNSRIPRVRDFYDLPQYNDPIARAKKYTTTFCEQIEALKRMNLVYKPKFLGFLYQFQAKYKTTFGDSLIIGYCKLSPDKKEFIGKPWMSIGDVAVGEDDSHIKKRLPTADKTIDLQYLNELLKDTMNLY